MFSEAPLFGVALPSETTPVLSPVSAGRDSSSSSSLKRGASSSESLNAKEEVEAKAKAKGATAIADDLIDSLPSAPVIQN